MSRHTTSIRAAGLRLTAVTDRLMELHSALGDVAQAELHARITAYQQHEDDNATSRRQRADVYAVDFTSTRIRIEAELAEYTEERDHLRFLIKYNLIPASSTTT